MRYGFEGGDEGWSGSGSGRGRRSESPPLDLVVPGGLVNGGDGFVSNEYIPHEVGSNDFTPNDFVPNELIVPTEIEIGNRGRERRSRPLPVPPDQRASSMGARASFRSLSTVKLRSRSRSQSGRRGGREGRKSFGDEFWSEFGVENDENVNENENEKSSSVEIESGITELGLEGSSLAELISRLGETEPSDHSNHTEPPQTHISFKNAHLKSIPTLPSPSIITFLDLSRNRLTHLPVSFFTSLSSVRVLDLSDNLIVSLEGIGVLSELRVLRVGNNYLEGVEKVARGVEVLDFKGNRVKSFGESMLFSWIFQQDI